MTAPPQVVGLPWYDRDDYPVLLLVFSDPDKLPNTFDAWLEHAEGLEKQLQAAGFLVARAWIRPVPFAAWCGEETYHQISKRDWSLRMKLRGSTTPDRRSVADLKLRLFPDSPYAKAHGG